MSKLPKVQVARFPESSRRSLAAWLAEWQVDEALRAEADERVKGGGIYPVKDATAARAAPAAVTAGQILLLRPFSAALAERPRYLAALARQPAGWLVAPFGRFSTPAVPGELATGRDAPPLRILCLWNAALVPQHLLERSWVTDRLTKPELSAALSLYRSIRDGEPPPRQLADRMGPPLQHPLDPRRDYLEEESGWMSPLRSAAGQASEDRPLRLAAERRATYRTRKPKRK